MRKILIEIYYQTGDSFSSEDITDYIEHEWSNLEMAKKCIKRIKNNNEFYLEHQNQYRKPTANLPEGVVWDEQYRMIMLELLDDNGKPFLHSAFWQGYFEKLHHAKITFKEDEDFIYEPDSLRW